METGTEYLSQEKFDELAGELEHLKGVKRREIAQNLEYTKSLGDLAENAEYHAVREAQASLEDRIMKIESLLKSARIIASRGGDNVDIGSTVVLQKEGEKGTVKYRLVGSEEVDLPSGKLSVHSPLGSTLLNRRKGDRVDLSTPIGIVKYRIISVE